jgi:hypothetical protein
MRFGTAFITTAFFLTALTTTVSASPVFAPQGTHHAPKAASPPPLACPPARTCPPTSALANHSSLVLLPRPAAARHDQHAPAARCAATNASVVFPSSSSLNGHPGRLGKRAAGGGGRPGARGPGRGPTVVWAQPGCWGFLSPKLQSEVLVGVPSVTL